LKNSIKQISLTEMQTLLSSKRYKDFVVQRNRALEQIHINTQIDLTRITHAMLAQIENIAASAAIRVGHTFSPTSISTHFEIAVRDIMTQSFPLLVRRILKQRRATYILSYAGEQEAIGRATKLGAGIERADFAKRLKDEESAPTLLGALDKRVWLALMYLRHDIVKAFELAVSQELTAIEVVDKIKGAFPDEKIYKNPPKVLTRVHDAAGDDGEDPEDKSWFTFDFIDDADWNMAVDAYTGTELPPGRGDVGYDPINETKIYGWQLEAEDTEDFVRSVRDGQIEGAQDLGVKDFVWIAVLDDKTCDDCCVPRAGMLLSEIADMDDDCDSDTPPAHFNCRCDIGPVASTDEVEGPDWASFNDWLEN
jgi:hypothetical protein